MHRSALLAVLCLPLVAAAGAPGARLSAPDLAARIDEHLAARLNQRKVPAAPAADDAELVRRLHLDLTGRIPDILAARDFIDNPGKDKRARLVEQLLADERYPLHWANVWRSWVVPDTNDLRLFATPGAFEDWILEELKRNTPYDRIVTSLLTNGGNAGSQVFLQVHQGKPENLASATSRLFLGVKLECAQCHN